MKTPPLALLISLVLVQSVFAQQPQTVLKDELRRGWTLEPFRHGYSVLEREYGYSTYDSVGFDVKTSRFPIDAIKGKVRIPVFLVDWSDFNPVTDRSNKDSSRSKGHRDYKQHTPEEIQAYMNSDTGPAGYFKAASGGQLTVEFVVYPWISSAKSNYLKDKEPNYYRYEEKRDQWIAYKKDMAMDVLRAMVAEQGFNPHDYDADGNKAIDGFIIAYEGGAGELSGKNMSSLAPITGSMGNFKDLVPQEDPNYKTFQEMDILFGRYINMPETSMVQLRTLAHETGHMLLGYKDYYYPGANGERICDLGEYATSARGSHFSPAAMEKYLYGKWIHPQVVTNGNLTLDSHHLAVGESYLDQKSYLHQVFVDDDPFHYFLIEYRHFDPDKRSFDYNQGISPSSRPQSGLVIFEVNENNAIRKAWRSSIARHSPEHDKESPYAQVLSKRRTYQEGEEFSWSNGEFKIQVSDISYDGEVARYRLVTSHGDHKRPDAPANLQARITDAGVHKLEWSSPEEGAAVAGYFLDVAEDAAFQALHDDYKAKALRLNTAHELTSLAPDKKYYAQVWSIDTLGNRSPYSDTIILEAN
jgi:M6 family metalloprotease-like protein